MRDLLLVVILGILVFPSLRRPAFAASVFLILGIAQPHRFVYGFAYDFPWVQIYAGILFFSIAVNGHFRYLGRLQSYWLPLIFFLWTLVTTALAIRPDLSGERLMEVLKIQLGVLLILLAIKDKNELRQIVIVIAACIGYFGVKGMAFMIRTGGQWKVQGPPEGMLSDNNNMAVALVFAVPLLLWVSSVLDRRWLKALAFLAVAGCVFSAIGTYSRGGFLALASLAFFVFIYSKQRLKLTALLIPIIGCALWFMPDKFWDRIDTISTYEEDASSLERLNTWEAMYNLASNRLTGGGFSAYQDPNSTQPYSPRQDLLVRAAHSIYFQVLGDHGFIGLLMYFAIFIQFFSATRGWKRQSLETENKSDHNLAVALQVAVASFLLGSAFLSLAYWEVLFTTVALALSWKAIHVGDLKAPAAGLDATDPKMQRSLYLSGTTLP